MKLYKYIVSAALVAIFLPCWAQEADSLIIVPTASKADSLVNNAEELRKSYNFIESISIYRKAIEAEIDTTLHSAIEEKIVLAENGANMTDFVYIPNVIAKRTFPIETFFLNYPLPDKSWHPVLDSLNTNPYTQVVYFEANEEPEQVEEDEIYPLLSEDGRSLYFASKSQSGIGGYDLFVKEWNPRTRSWSAPTNLGLPFSSPYDDMLYMDTLDGKYSIFASNRECSADSMTVYVLEHDSLPIHEKINDPERLRNIMKLVPREKESLDNQEVIYESESVRDYVLAASKIKSLKAEIYDNFNEELLDSLSAVTARAQKLEMELLLQGIEVDLDKYEQRQQEKSVALEYNFIQMTLGEQYIPPVEEIVEPEPIKKK